MVWLTTFPPMIDLPQHAAQVAIFLRLLQGTEPWADVYRINWLTPYWAGYALTAVLALWMPAVVAIKLVVSAAVSMTSIAAAYLRRESGGSVDWDWLFLPIGFGFAFDWGLFNFLVAVPIALCYLALSLNYLRHPSLYRATAVALASSALLLCHILIVLFACAMGVMLAFLVAGNTRLALRRIAPFIAPAPIVLLWWLFVLLPEAQAQSPSDWNISLARLGEVVVFAAGQQNDWLGIQLALLAICAPVLFGARCMADKRWCIPFALFLLWMLLGPDCIFGNGFTYQRFGVFFFPMLVLALRPGTGGFKAGRYWLPAIGLALTLPIAFRLHSFEQESADYRKVAATIPPGGRLLAAIVDRNSKVNDQPTYLHFGAWYSAQGLGMHEFSFAAFVPEIVRFSKKGSRPRIGIGLEWSPRVYTPAILGDFDYLLVRKGGSWFAVGPNTASPEAPCQLPIISRDGSWTLYRQEAGRLLPTSLSQCYFWQ